MRHDQKACPLCGERIEKTTGGSRRKYSCQNCGATINKLLNCDRCGTKRVWQGKKGLREEVGNTYGLLLPFKHEDGRLTLTDRAHGSRQRLQVGGKLSPLRPRDLAIDLVDDFQSALVHPAR